MARCRSLDIVGGEQFVLVVKPPNMSERAMKKLVLERHVLQQIELYSGKDPPSLKEMAFLWALITRIVREDQHIINQLVEEKRLIVWCDLQASGTLYLLVPLSKYMCFMSVYLDGRAVVHEVFEAGQLQAVEALLRRRLLSVG